MSEEMEGVEAVYGTDEAEINDIPSWVMLLTSKFQEIEETISELSAKIEEMKESTFIIKRGMEEIANLAEEQNMLISQQESETPGASLDTSFNEEKLTPTAKKLIADVQGSPLDPIRLQDFLMEKSFGKPHPPLLPIVRGYTSDIRGLCAQLREFQLTLKKAHREYMTTHRKDANLDKRIKRLVENIEQELSVEERDGRRQAAITESFSPQIGN